MSIVVKDSASQIDDAVVRGQPRNEQNIAPAARINPSIRAILNGTAQRKQSAHGLNEAGIVA